MFEILFSIPFADDKTVCLKKLSIKLDLLKILIRLSKDTKALSNSRCLRLQANLQEIGKMLGGWIRAAKQNLP